MAKAHPKPETGGDKSPKEFVPGPQAQAIIEAIAGYCTPNMFIGDLYAKMKNDLGIVDNAWDYIALARDRGLIEEYYLGDDQKFRKVEAPAEQPSDPPAEPAAEQPSDPAAPADFEKSMASIAQSFGAMADMWGKYLAQMSGVIGKWDAVATEILPSLLAAQAGAEDGGEDGGQENPYVAPLQGLVDAIKVAHYPHAWFPNEVIVIAEFSVATLAAAGADKALPVPFEVYAFCKRLSPHDEQVHLTSLAYSPLHNTLMQPDFVSNGQYRVTLKRYLPAGVDVLRLMATIFAATEYPAEGDQ